MWNFPFLSRLRCASKNWRRGPCCCSWSRRISSSSWSNMSAGPSSDWCSALHKSWDGKPSWETIEYFSFQTSDVKKNLCSGRLNKAWIEIHSVFKHWPKIDQVLLQSIHFSESKVAAWKVTFLHFGQVMSGSGGGGCPSSAASVLWKSKTWRTTSFGWTPTKWQSGHLYQCIVPY